MAVVKVIAHAPDYDEIMDTIVGSLVICGYHIKINEHSQDDRGLRRAIIDIENGGPQDCGQCGNVQVVGI